MEHETHRSLEDVLEESRALGFLGPGPIGPHLENAAAFLPEVAHSRKILDLGSGGGLPGLVVAEGLQPTQELVLLDAMEKRCRFLERAISSRGLEGTVSVRCGRAEELAREPELRASFDRVLCRSFGPPAVTAECAVGFLTGPGARIVVSEPPGSDGSRWDPTGLDELGLSVKELRRHPHATLVLLEATRAVPDRYPRRSGVPSKRPVF